MEPLLEISEPCASVSLPPPLLLRRKGLARRGDPGNIEPGFGL